MSEESIYNLIPVPNKKERRPPRYHSHYSSEAPGFDAASGFAAAGTKKKGSLLATTEKPDPKRFLRRHAKKPDLPEPGKFTYSDRRKPALDMTPSATLDKQQQQQRKKKNFVKDNALEIIASPPKVKSPARAGDGAAAMSYRNKPDYGKVPEYLQLVKQEIEEEQEYLRGLVRAEADEQAKNTPQVKVLAEEERVKLLESLRTKWDLTNREYQKMSHRTSLDTIHKTKQKEALEQELIQLERAIEKMSKPVIFVRDDE